MAFEITDANFNKTITSNKVVVVDFTAAWCGPCKALSPVIDQLATEFKGRAIIGKLDVDSNPTVTAQFGVRNIPAILFFKDGKVADKQVGGSTKTTLEAKINSLL